MPPLRGRKCALIAALALFTVPLAAQGVTYISPNNDGVQDTLEVRPSIKDKRYITEWELSIEDERGNTVRSIRNKDSRPPALGFKEFWRILTTPKRSVDVPKVIVWDGRDENGWPLPDGIYTYALTAVNDNGLRGVSGRRTVVIDCTPPAVTLFPPDAADLFFGAGAKAELRIRQQGWSGNQPSDLWTGQILDARGQAVRTFSWNENPAGLVWDGLKDDGRPAPDGLYFYSITGVDRAGNKSETARVNNIVYSPGRPSINIQVSGSRYFSGSPHSARKSVMLALSVPAPASGNTLQSWKIELADNAGRGKVARVWQGGADEKPPSQLVITPGEGGSALADGSYVARVSASYRNGYTAPQTPSPVFYLVSAAPGGEVAVFEPKNAVFSPGSGQGRDAISFDERLDITTTSWQAEIRDGAGTLVKSFARGEGKTGRAPARNVWDGYDERGRLCDEGAYTYRVFTTDLAGNASQVAPAAFTIDRTKTELGLELFPAAFSPNGDGVQDTVTARPLVLKTAGIESWEYIVRNDKNETVRTEKGAGSPPPFTWDGKTDGGALAPDNRYIVSLRARAANSVAPIEAARAVTLRNAGPQAQVAAASYATTFSPDGDGLKDTLPLDIKTSAEERWSAVIRNEKGEAVWSKEYFNTNVSSFEWDGTDNSGNRAADGTYRFELSSTDAAGNTARAALDPITLDTRPVSLFLSRDHDYITPKRAQTWRVNAGVKDGLQSWVFRVYESERPAAPVKELRGDGGLPASLSWDGRRADGSAAEGTFAASLEAVYWRGSRARAESAPFLCAARGPEAEAALEPEFFSPDNDGADDELVISLKARSLLPLSSWSFTVYDYSPAAPGGRGKPFWTISGGAGLTARTVWNGKSNRRGAEGELVQSATDYPYVFAVTDVEGQSAEASGLISVDVLVIREGERLRIRVPAITFRGDAADFEGLSKEVRARNDWILGRVSRALSRFKDYTVQIEGHANPVLGTEAEKDELLRLSRERAGFVLQALVKSGISAARLSSEGVGAARPVPGVDPRDRENNWKNRRVEFILNK